MAINPKNPDLINSFYKTSLDLESPLPLGGPNRTNSTNIESGQYTNVNYTSGGSINTVTLQQWTPNRTYLDSFKSEEINRERETRIPNTIRK